VDLLDTGGKVAVRQDDDVRRFVRVHLGLGLLTRCETQVVRKQYSVQK
jgi:hypothetical protein